MNKNDLRYQATEKTITTTFWQLMAEVGFDKLSVKLMVLTANLNRTTFYRHYPDKYALLAAQEDTLLAGLKAIVTPVPMIQLLAPVDNYLLIDLLDQLTDYVHLHGQEFTLLFADNGSPSFQKKFGQTIREIWQQRGATHTFKIPENYIEAISTGVVVSLIFEWVRDGFKESNTEFRQILLTLSSYVGQSI